MKSSSILATAVLGTAATAKIIPVKVGESGLNFDPAEFTAAKGDVIEFSFYGLNHSVAQAGLIGTPCVPIPQGGFFSGYIPVAAGMKANTTFQVTVNDTSFPLYFYCPQPSRTHCKAGMVGVVNGPPGALASYKASAANSTFLNQPASVYGGLLVTSSGNATTTSTPTTASATSSTGSATATVTSGAAVPGKAVEMGGVVGAVALGMLGLF